MKISLVSPGFPPQLGGVEVVVGQLAESLHLSGHDVAVYAQRPRRSSFPVTHEYPVHRFRDVTGSREFPVAPGLARALWRDRRLFDVVHAHSFHAVPALMAATVPSVPFVFTPHFHAQGHTRLASALHVVYDPLATALFRRADKVTCVSAAEAELLLHRYPSAESRLVIVPNGVDLDAILAAEPLETDRPVVLVAGRLESYKRVDAAVRAFARMSAEARLVICGTGSHQPALERLVHELGIAHDVSFRGVVGDEELRRWQRTASSTVSLSTREAFGLTLFEAAVAGSRVVASDIPAHAELAGRIGRFDDRMTLMPPESSTDALADMLDHQVRAGPLSPLRDAGLDWSLVAQQFLDIYRSVS